MWFEQIDAGQPQFVVTDIRGPATRHLVDFGARPSLTADGALILYRRIETGRLTLVDVSSGASLGDVDSRNFLVGEINGRSVLAAATWSSPGESNELCVFGVATRVGNPLASEIRPS